MTMDELRQGHRRHQLEDMEKEIYLDRYTVSYSGYFIFKEFMDMVNRWCKENGYFRDVQSSSEKVKEDSTTKGFSFQLQKMITPAHLSVLNVDIEFSNMTEEEKEVDGRKMDVNKGDVEIVFHGYLMSSRKSRWETKANVYFFRMLIDKFIYKLDKPKFKAVCVNDGKALGAEMKGLLNTYKSRIKE